MSAKTILVVDDEAEIIELLTYNLKREGYQVSAARTGEEALDCVKQSPPQLIVLDLMLPGIDGLEVCRTLKATPETARIPIIMLTAKTEDIDIVTGLELGAEDYVTKPFSPKVLVARIRSVFRRIRKTSTPPRGDTLEIDSLAVDPARHKVTIDGNRIDLTATEFAILHLLLRRRGWVLTRSQIIEAVKGDDYPVTERSVDVHIVSLRKKLGGLGPRIETVRGVGYRFQE